MAFRPEFNTFPGEFVDTSSVEVFEMSDFVSPWLLYGAEVQRQVERVDKQLDSQQPHNSPRFGGHVVPEVSVRGKVVEPRPRTSRGDHLLGYNDIIL